MNYTQACGYVDSLGGRGIKPGLSGIRALCSALGDPQESLRTIHIAGTNGKGSTGAFIESILMSAGLSVCRFASPAVLSRTDMFTFGSKPVTEAEYAEAVSETAAASEILARSDIYPTSFETETAAAFLMFKKRAPDFAVIECGMGGRLDCTNVISRPAVSVITPVSIDHTAFLGSTAAEIAGEKAGIIKRGAPVVAAPQPDDAEAVIRRAAAGAMSPLYTVSAPANVRFYGDKTVFDTDSAKELVIRLLGGIQPVNAAAAAKTAAVLRLYTP